MKRALIFALVLGCRAAPASSGESFTLSAGALRVIMPAHANGVVHIERSPGAFVDVRPTHGIAASARVTGDRVVYEADGVRLTHVVNAGRIEEFRHVERSAEALSYRVRLGPALTHLRVIEDFIEALDARGVALLRTEPAYLVDARGVRRDLQPTVARVGDEWSVSWPIDDTGLTYPLDIDPAWTVTTSMTRPRRDNTLHLLPSGKVLSAGGQAPTGTALTTTELWDPATSSWTASGALQRPRAYHAGCTLPSGKVLLASGTPVGGMPDIELSAEIYDPATSTSTLISGAAAAMGSFSRATVLSPTRVMIAHDGASQVLDVNARTWTFVPYVEARFSITTTLLASGKVLLAGGGVLVTGAKLSSAEIFDPASNAWTKVAPMKRARERSEAVTLLTGKALFAGGVGGESTAEIYDPIADTWTLTPPMTDAHSYNGMMLLSTGKALNAGGDNATGLSDIVDLYDPVANTWSFAGKLVTPLDDYGYTALSGGRAMIAGGGTGGVTATTQIFEQQANGKACLGAGECTSGFCVDGACCEKSACASGQTCGGSGAPGTCLKTDGASCANNAECGSAHCVDGFCCNSACDDVCGACNVKGSEGKCAAVPAGDAPRGSRGACPGDGACAARCGGIDKTKCTQFPSAPVICAPPKCESGQETRARGCDGAGSCASVESRACAPYVCGGAACRTQCEVDSDCVDGNTCDLVTRKCVIAATCEGDHAVKSPDGNVRDCAPFRCSSGRCGDACTDSSACAPGYVCDTGSTRCVLSAAAADDSSGGCALAPTAQSGGSLIALMFALGLLRRRSDRGRPKR